MPVSSRREFLKGLGLGAAGLALGEGLGRVEGAPAARRPPNILFILADDIGYGDLSCYGATRIKTPNLDRLAAAGVRCTDVHAPSAMCSPTRYAVLTGEYAFRHGPVKRGVLSGMAPLCIQPDRMTTPRLLKQAGYTTGCVGKWHLGLGEGQPDFNGELKPGPLELGFDSFFGYPATGDRVPCVYVRDHRVVNLDPKDPIQVSYAGKVGDDPTGREHPELLKMKLSHGHDSTIINGISRIGFMSGGKAARWKDEEIADTFTRKAVEFIERNKAKPFFLYFASHDVHVPRVPNPRFRGKSGCGVRGDAVMEFDWSVGQVMDALQRNGLADNTLIIVTSDNGGVVDDGYADGAPEDLNGHSVNGPLRGFKAGLYEGGTRVPLIARWPGHIQPHVSKDLVCLVDLMATCGAVTGRELPKDAGPDSFNVLPVLTGTGQSPRDHVILHAGGGALAMRKGPWKLIPNSGPETPRVGPRTELFNLDDDLAETKNVAAEHPEVVKELWDRLQQAREAGKTRPGG